MKIDNLLIANRGEIAIRVARAAAELGLRTVAVYSEDDAGSLHVRMADDSVALNGVGAAAYLDGDRIVQAAEQAGCRAIHPGYGFLSENADFARRVGAQGLTFVGPEPETLDMFGDKTRARALARELGVPVASGTAGPTELDDARSFLEALEPGAAMMIKAIAGGGGRGMRVVRSIDQLDSAYAQCRAEATAAFGDDGLYVEHYLANVRHIEVQIVGDGTGAVIDLGERDCSIQRRRQKLVEIAPAPGLPAVLRARLCEAAVRLGQAVGYRGVGTCEFLVDAAMDAACPFYFIEANPRLQVEHTVTEQVTGLDLVKLQLRIAAGGTLGALGLGAGDSPAPRGLAMQARINLERLDGDGTVRPSAGRLTVFEPPTGPGVRLDSAGHAGYSANPNFDSLLAKVVAWVDGPDLAAVAGRLDRALDEFRLAGAETNKAVLQNLLRHPDFLAGRFDTGFVENHAALLAKTIEAANPRPISETTAGRERAGAAVDQTDPLAVLDHGKATRAGHGEPGLPDGTGVPAEVTDGPPDTLPIVAPMQGTVVSIGMRTDDLVHVGQEILVMEAMKMHHVVAAATAGLVRQVTVGQGDTVYEGHPLAFIEAREVAPPEAAAEQDVDLDEIRPDLAEVQARHALGFDAARPDAVTRRHKTGQRTARANVVDLVDPDSFIEYGPLIIAAQRGRRSIEDLIERTPADGLIAGIGRVNGGLFPDMDSRCVVMSYDYTVLAGTQGFKNHEKKDRLFELAEKWRLPVVFFTEGGGGRPGDTDWVTPAGLHVMAFHYFARLSALVPLIGITSGRCFAGNAALLGCCDVVIATANSSIGMGGPAMIEGGGLGVFRPEQVGPMAVQVPNGVIDIAVADEAEAVQVAKRYLGYFQGPLDDWQAADQRLLRRAIPEDRLRIYDVRAIVETLADTGSVLELRPAFGLGMVTALIRIEGRTVGVVANNPKHLAGAVDSDGADKAARFLQLCDAFAIPILTLIDTPGMMVGPEVEKTALVRHCCRLFVNGANLTVPIFAVVLRKAYGLGAQAMAGGSFKAPFFTVAWPTGEFGGMGLEGAVKLGFRKELAAEGDPAARQALFDEMVAKAYQDGKALNTATYMEFDDVIDPADTRKWLVAGLRSQPPTVPRTGKRRTNIDTW